MIKMGLSETPEHARIKYLLTQKLQEWFGVSISEYPSSGHELDVFSTTIDSVSVYVEIIWSKSHVHFLSDLTMILESDAQVKVVVGSPEIISNESFGREFSKAVNSQRRLGFCMHGQILDGKRIIEDSAYLENDVKSIMFTLVEKAKRAPLSIRKSISVLKASSSQKNNPDTIQEQLLSNIVPLVKLPERIFASKTTCRYPMEIIDEVGEASYRIPFLLKEGKLYCFADIGSSDSPFSKVIFGGVWSFAWQEWLADRDKRNWLVDLLNQAIRKYCRGDLGLYAYKNEKKFFFPSDGPNNRIIRWKPSTRVVSRTVAKAVRRADGAVSFWYHHAASLVFIFIGDTIYLKIEPGLVFTDDGRHPILSRRIGPLTTRWQRREYNKAYLNHVRFWIQFLSKERERILIQTGADDIEISTRTVDAELSVGIADDTMNVEQMFETLTDEVGL